MIRAAIFAVLAMAGGMAALLTVATLASYLNHYLTGDPVLCLLCEDFRAL